MNIVTLHNETVLAELESAIKKADKKAVIHAFTKKEDAAGYIKSERVDAVFLDYRLDGAKPEDLFEEFSALQENLNLIFITGWGVANVPREFEKKISGAIGRPVMGNDVRRELDNLKYKVPESLHEYFMGTCEDKY